MMESALNLQIPYIEPISGNLIPGTQLKICGIVTAGAFRFNVNLQCGPNNITPDDIPLQIEVNVLEGYALINVMQDGVWGEPYKITNISIQFEEEFEIAILFETINYRDLEKANHTAKRREM